MTDPPYGVSFKSASGLTIQNDSIKDEEFYSFLLAAFGNMAACLEKGGAAYVFHADTEGLNFRRAFIEAGFHLAGCCIWVKDSLVLGRSDYQWQHEPVLYGFLQNGKHPWYSDRKQTTVWNFAKPKRNANHPTSKPLDLLAYPIGNSSQENAIVLDTFGGSGSTMMACEQSNRICCMMLLYLLNSLCNCSALPVLMIILISQLMLVIQLYFACRLELILKHIPAVAGAN